MNIGIVYRFTKDNHGNLTRLYVAREFKDIFDELKIGIVPIISDNDEIINMCDRLIIPGSYANVNPKEYDEEKIEGIDYSVDEYTFDKLILEKFYKQNKPILGICAGNQEINVNFGGTLFQKINNHNDTRHKIIIDKGTKLFEIVGKEEKEVNSLHNQAVKDVAKNFIIGAKSKDGVVESLECSNILTVQWHPEIDRDIDFFHNWIIKYL